MSEHHESAPAAGLSRNKIILGVIVALTLAVVGISLTTNITTMYDRWDNANRGQQPELKSSQKHEKLDIVSGERRHTFMVEVMRTEGDRARGLMHRRSLPQDQGMLFDFQKDQIVSMWMKNTYIPLDMIFLTADGRIHRIEHRTEPESEKAITSGAPVRGVLELNGGTAARLNLKAGDYIHHTMFR